MPVTVEKLGANATKIVNEAKRLLGKVREKMPPELVEFASTLAAALPELEADNDRRHKREVNLGLARQLQVATKSELAHALDAVHQLVGEDDPVLRDEVPHCSPDLVRKARTLFLKVTVTFVASPAKDCERRVEAHVLGPDGRTVSKVTDTCALSFDDLPSEFRERNIRGGETHFEFKLVPRS